MEELLEFLNKRVEFLRGFEEEDNDLEIDGEEIYESGVEAGKFKEAVFIRDKVKKILSR